MEGHAYMHIAGKGVVHTPRGEGRKELVSVCWRKRGGKDKETNLTTFWLAYAYLTTSALAFC